MKKFTMIFAALVLAGCTTQSTQQTQENTPSETESKTIITSFYPIEFLTREIAGNNFEIINLTKGKDPHSYSLTPQDIQNIENSDLFVFQGANLEPWAEDFEDSETLNVLELSENIDLLEYSEEKHEDDHSDEDHHDEEDHEDEDHHEEEGDEHGHNHGEFDPHTWLDPILAQEMASQIFDELNDLDPSNSEIYTQNYQNLEDKLNDLHDTYSETLSSCSNKKAVSSHDAFSYLEKRYDFKLFPIAGLSPQSLPSSQKIQELISLSSQENITHLLEEEFTDKSFSDVIKSEAGLETITISPIASTPEEGDYFTLMNNNLESFSIAFNCSE